MKLKEAGKVYLNPKEPIDLDFLRGYLKESAITVAREGLLCFFGHEIGLVKGHYIFTCGTGGEPHISENGRKLLEKKLNDLLESIKWEF
ncbi:MAG: hypothetical protein KKF68_00715 [Nanoarchaeota archaeon]|nr:hypothetical protein [Nanoarchaeota archaeon]